MRFNPEQAIPLLEAGAVFVFKPEPKKPRSRKFILRMRLRLSDGTYADGCWGYAKKRLERMARLSEAISDDGLKIWRLK